MCHYELNIPLFIAPIFNLHAACKACAPFFLGNKSFDSLCWPHASLCPAFHCTASHLIHSVIGHACGVNVLTSLTAPRHKYNILFPLSAKIKYVMWKNPEGVKGGYLCSRSPVAMIVYLLTRMSVNLSSPPFIINYLFLGISLIILVRSNHMSQHTS